MTCLMAQIYINITLVTKSIDILCENCKVILISNLILKIFYYGLFILFIANVHLFIIFIMVKHVYLKVYTYAMSSIIILFQCKDWGSIAFMFSIGSKLIIMSMTKCSYFSILLYSNGYHIQK